MAVSGETEFGYTVGQVITEALRELNAVAVGQEVSGEQFSQALLRLNGVMQAIQSKRKNVWTRVRGSQLLVAGKPFYNFGHSVLRVIVEECQIRRLGAVNTDGTSAEPIDYPISEITRRDYLSLPQRSTIGRPVQLMQDRTRTLASGQDDQQGGLVVWFYPTPDEADTFLFTAIRRYNDAAAASNNLDFPTQWGLAIIYELAINLVGRYAQSVTNFQRIERMRDHYMKIAEGDDTEDGGFEVRPSYLQFRGY